MTLNSEQISTKNFKKAIQFAKQKQGASLFVFDMDSTLFCMKYRTQAIIRDCLKDPLFCKNFPKHLELIRQIEVHSWDWSVQEILARYGFTEEEPLVLSIEKIWRKNFFTNDYLHLDQPYKGSVQFVQHIVQLGAKVCYLTARNRKNMFEGTLQSLKQWSFPMEEEEQLIIKEDPHLKDSEYKAMHLKKMAQVFDSVLFFENEPVILNETARSVPQVHLFWMNSTHSRQEEPPPSAHLLTTSYAYT